MPFVPEFSESAEAEFIDKAMTVIHRDAKPALDHFYPADNLPAFAVMSRGDLSEFRYPLLILGVERMSSEFSESGEWLQQELRIGVGLVVDGTSVAGVKKKAEKYVRAFKSVVREGILEMLPAASARVGYALVFNHRYFEHGTKGEVFTQPVEIEVQISFGEK